MCVGQGQGGLVAGMRASLPIRYALLAGIRESAERWPRMGKEEVARRLAEKVAETLGDEGGGLKLAAE